MAIRTPGADQYQPLQATTQVTNQPTYTADSFGAGTFRQIGAGASAALSLAKELANEREDFEKSQVKDSLNQAKIDLNNGVNDIILNNTGPNLQKRNTEISKLQTSIRQKYGGQMNPRQAPMFDAAFNDYYTGIQIQADDQTSRDVKTYDITTRKATISNLTNTYAKSTDMDFANENLLRAQGEALQLAGVVSINEENRSQYTPEQIAANDELRKTVTQEVKDRAYLERANFISTNSATAALEYVNGLGDISADTKTKLVASLSNAAYTEKIGALSGQYYNSGRTRNDILLAVGKDLPEAEANAVTDNLQKRWDRDDKLSQYRVGSYAQQELKSLRQNPVTWVAPKNGTLPGPILGAMQAYKDTAALNTDGDDTVFSQLQRQIAGEDWQNVYLQDYAENLSERQYSELLGLQVGRYEGKNLNPDQLVQVRTVSDILNGQKSFYLPNALQKSGLVGEQAMKRENLTNAYEREFDKRARQFQVQKSLETGKQYKLTPEDSEKIARRITLDFDQIQEKISGVYDINAHNLRVLGFNGSVGDYKKQLRKEIEANAARNQAATPGAKIDIPDSFLTRYFNYKLNQNLFSDADNP